MSARRSVEWVRRHPVPVDVAVAVVLAVLNVSSMFSVPAYVDFDFREPDALGIALTLLSCAAVPFRNRAPLPAFAAATVPSLGVLALGYPQSLGGVTALLTLYTVAARCSLRASVVAAVAAWLLLAVVLLVGPVPPVLGDWIGNTFVLTTGWALGRAVRAHRERVAGLEERNRALEEARESSTRAALAQERGRIAREMHDIVAHNLTAMTVQASAARRLVRRDPDAAEQALDAVQDAGRTALEELRRVLGVLRPGDADLQPQPGTAGLQDLVASVRAAGLDVELEEVGERVPLDPGVDLAAYRIVQESLTNALRHAGPAHVRVRIGWSRRRIGISVEDDGRGAATALGGGTGNGLALLRERAGVYGGQLHAGPRRGGGFALSAVLPTREQS